MSIDTIQNPADGGYTIVIRYDQFERNYLINEAVLNITDLYAKKVGEAFYKSHEKEILAAVNKEDIVKRATELIVKRLDAATELVFNDNG